jgi:hypothetical protein
MKCIPRSRPCYGMFRILRRRGRRWRWSLTFRDRTTTRFAFTTKSVEQGQDAIDRLMIEASLAPWLPSAQLTRTRIDRNPDSLVCHDHEPHP